MTATPEHAPAVVRGYWRFLEKADAFVITPAKMLAPHHQRTIERMRMQEMVLCVFRHHLPYACAVRGSGGDWSQPDYGEGSGGGHLHAMLALNGEGLPLGVLRCAYGKPGRVGGSMGCETSTRRSRRCRARRVCCA